ncbi:hypothetical protein ACQUJZ_24090 [Ralstonia pseudosolanacearum]|uniref:hypothetical protein n=1 Tax=Ralstonia pseudosolanacearum TaxID=1310165 RepID=UPI001E60DA60|nr:hypothetical protein [Ralstonia pseudosolanacearum]
MLTVPRNFGETLLVFLVEGGTISLAMQLHQGNLVRKTIARTHISITLQESVPEMQSSPARTIH